MVTASKLAVNTSATADQMAASMFGDGMTIVSATYTGDNVSSGIYTGGDTVSPGTTPSDTGVILSTGQAGAYTNASGNANQSASTGTDTGGVDGDAGLDAIAGSATYDASIFEAVFIPTGDTLTMQFTFSSEEYLEYVNSGYNDAFGVWVNGVKTSLSVGSGEVSINDVNDLANQNLFIDNTNSDYNTEMDGFTVTLSLKAPLNVGQQNTIKIGIADGGDATYDSNLLIAGNSIQSVTITQDDAINIGQNGSKDLNVLGNDSSVAGGLTVTHINGVAVNPGDSVTLSTGEVITLNANGKLTIDTDADLGTNAFTYQVEDASGNTDIGFVEVTTTVPCFAGGTMIETADGNYPVEDLRIGMQIRTRDFGKQTLRWIGTCKTKRTEAHASVVFRDKKKHPDLEVSQNHRMVIRSKHADMLFGSDTVLVAAKDLVNGKSVTLNTSGTDITYFHLMFDTHQIVRANGRWSESFYPGEQILSIVSEDTRAELFDMFPSLDSENAAPLGPAAAMILRKHEVATLIDAMNKA